MTSTQNTRVKMIDAVLTLLTQNPLIVALIAALGTLKTQLTALRAQITTLENEQQSAITGITADKANKRKVLETNAFGVGGAVAAYANATNNKTLYDKVAYTQTDFARATDADLITFANIIYDAANANMAALLPYGVTPASLPAYRTMITDFVTLVTTPRNAIALRKSYTEQLDAKITAAMGLIKDGLDKTVDSLLPRQPDFVNTYRLTRKLTPTGARATSLRGVVTDAMTGAVIVGAKVTIVELQRFAVTDIAGVYGIDTFRPKLYTVLVEAPGFDPITFANVDFRLGKVTTLNVPLQRMVMQMAKAA